MLPYVGDPQSTFLILRLCAVPRANHLLRTLPPPEALAYCRAHDEQLAGAVRSLLYTQENLRRESHLIVTLPCRYSGLGIRSAERTAPAAYFAGWAAALPIWRARFPQLLAVIMDTLRDDGPVRSARGAVAAASTLASEGWPVPAWRDLASGALPAASADDPAAEAGEWRHGWQFYAADARES